VTAVWATSKGITDGYMTLRDVKGGPATSPEGDVTATRIEAPSGEAWLVIDNVPDDPPPTSATRIMWWRDDGRVWIVSNFGLSPENLTTLALQIEAGPNGSYTLPDASMTLVGSASLASHQSMTQAWTLDGHNLSLTVANGGLAQQVSDLPVHAIAERTIAGHPGYALTLSNGQVNLIWPTDHEGWWASISSKFTLQSDDLSPEAVTLGLELDDALTKLPVLDERLGCIRGVERVGPFARVHGRGRRASARRRTTTSSASRSPL
jgi:hypothetical protein